MATGKVVAVGDTATLIHQAADNAGAEVHLFNPDAGDIDLGGAGVTTGAGFTLPAAGTAADLIVVRLRAGEALYGISAAAATNNVEVLVTGE